MATRAGTNNSKKDNEVVEKASNDEVSVNIEEDAELAKVEEELEAENKETNKNAKSALTRLEKAVENAREKGWTVSGHVSRLDTNGVSEGNEL